MRFIKPIALTFLLPAIYCTTPSTAATAFRAEARAILAQDTVSWNQNLPFDNEVVKGKLKMVLLIISVEMWSPKKGNHVFG